MIQVIRVRFLHVLTSRRMSDFRPASAYHQMSVFSGSAPGSGPASIHPKPPFGFRPMPAVRTALAAYPKRSCISPLAIQFGLANGSGLSTRKRTLHLGPIVNAEAVGKPYLSGVCD
jgi:hypothetical protein